jgi:hypothetical protein
VISILRRGRTTPWPDEPTEAERLEQVPASAAVPEETAGSREHLQLLLDRLRQELSPVGLELFQRLIVDDEPLAEVSQKTGKSPQALYQWRSRLLRRVRELSAEILGDQGEPQASDPGPERRIVKGTTFRP